MAGSAPFVSSKLPLDRSLDTRSHSRVTALAVLFSFCVVRSKILMYCRKTTTTTTMTLGQIYEAWRCYYRAFVYFRAHRNLACADFVMSPPSSGHGAAKRRKTRRCSRRRAGSIDARGDIRRSRSARSSCLSSALAPRSLGRTRRRVSVSHYISRTIIRLFGI